LILACAGCATYLTPGGAVNLQDVNRTDAADIAARRALPHFPASFAVVRVQAPAYRSFSSAAVGDGRYSVLTAPELLTPEVLATLAKWPSVADVSALDPQPVPPRYDSLDDLRLAAAKIQADILLVYTINTAFTFGGHAYPPLTAIPLGHPPDPDASVTATATALFVDVRTGFAYGSAEASAQAHGVPAGWPAGDAVDAQRREVEHQAFDGLMLSGQKTWSDIVDRYQ